MRPTHYLYIIPFMALAACDSEELSAPMTSADSRIVLSAGIVEGSQEATTRAAGEDTVYLALTANTAIALQVSSTWTGHSLEPVVKSTTATVEAASAPSTTNDLDCDPVLYWDDFGSADPANRETGRQEGLTIYGVAVDGLTKAPAVSDFIALQWDVNSDQTTGWTTKDLLISNNVKGDDAYKFDARNDGKQLVFRHALTKITVNLKAGEGFENEEFVNDPTVTLLEWAHTNGTVDVTTGGVTFGTATGATMYQSATAATGYNVTKEALVMPGSAFVKGENIIKINADGNIYYVTSEKIRAAINSTAHDTADLTEAGKNYIINVVVDKTDIKVTATVKDWDRVEAETELPKINVDKAYGATGSSFDKTFDFYRSTALDNGYSKDSKMNYDATKGWTMTPQLYWPDHNTHYQFRGVWPETTTDAYVISSPRIETATYDGKDYQVIKVGNVAYQKETFPSDLMIARPEIDDKEKCSNQEPGHTTTLLYNGGICATEGSINLNFRYMMAQVEVNLKSEGEAPVSLAGAKVELVGVKNSGDVTLGTREVFPTGEAGVYTLNVDATDNNKRLSAIVPQNLNGVKFRITIFNGTEVSDVYYADVASIVDQASGSKITEWKSGEHYVYSLNLQKTKLTISATLTNWKTVNASENVWF